MQENFLHFLSDVPSNLECNGQNIGFIDNERIFELDLLTKTEHVFINYIPISQSQQSIPYTFKLNTENTPFSDNSYIKIIPFPNNHYDIIMKPFYYYQITDSQVLYSGSIDKYFISITNNEQTNITIFSGANIVFNKSITKIINVKVEKNENVIVITGIIDENNYHLILIDITNFNLVYDDIIQSIEDCKNIIKTYKPINTLCNHAKVFNYNFSTKESDTFYVYEDDNEKSSIPPILIPQAFLECVKIQDENLCKSFLTNNFNNTKIEHLEGYFGKINEIYFNRHQTNSNKINYTIKSDRYRNYNFLLDNNKIYDIEEIF